MSIRHLSRFLLAPAGMLMALAASCALHDTDLALHNDPPAAIGSGSVRDTLYYPDSTVCTLSVSDLNDSILTIAKLDASDTTGRASPPCSTFFPVRGMQTTRGLGPKQMVLLLGGTRMGCYVGSIAVQDQQQGADTLTIQIVKLFRDPLEAFPPDTTCWRRYDSGDTSHVKLEFMPRPQLKFTFDKSQADSASPATAGIMSRFALSGDFRVSVNYQLRHDMLNGFEVGFFVSSKSDTGRWAPRAGLFLTAPEGTNKGEWVRIDAKSTNAQSVSQETELYAGWLGLERAGKRMVFRYRDANPASTPAVLDENITYDAGDTVYVHLRMGVSDHRRVRHCTWWDFVVDQGQMAFNR